MQKLRKRRLTDTPWGAAQAPCNCGLPLNREETLSVAGLDPLKKSMDLLFSNRILSSDSRGSKTFLNNSDAHLTREQGECSMLAFVLNKKGKPLMPCSPGKAKRLLKDNKARVAKRTPFTIRLLYGSSGYKQPVALGVDTGYENAGVSAVSEKKELFTAEIQLRTDIVKLLTRKRQYRRSRRYRLWYRKPRFLNRSKPDGWLAPSIQNKLDAHIKVINQVKQILPICEINVEAASFDIQKIKSPDIQGTGYQNGPQKDFWNVREYVLYRDNHTCQHCKGKSKDKILNVHHIKSVSEGGTDRPDNLITLCETCHKDYHDGKIALKVKLPKEFKAETFMSMVRWKLVNRLRESGNTVDVTYGYVTKTNRIALGLGKSHLNDAFAIANGIKQERTSAQYFIKQVRKCNRSLFKANLLKGGKRKVNTIREAFGFHRFDKVLYGGTECFIYGLRSSGYFDVRKLDGTKMHGSAKAVECTLLENSKTMLIERRMALLPVFTGGVSEP